ncbi:MAG: hypothetical protein F6J90_18020 [Moorea sp. SIOASIH]|uniref:hypothetical protein n=1 Tax=Moorena sp. SIOASIH TaxID=2607817 RepID=UPI0013BC25DF|nr:hypothetical protein [Moorena sp. SIOASIH]NEO38123.1 hypothetical protein [Moorena sp. SIOASIH]
MTVSHKSDQRYKLDIIQLSNKPSNPIPCSLFPIPYSLFPIPYSLFPISYSLFPIP